MQIRHYQLELDASRPKPMLAPAAEVLPDHVLCTLYFYIHLLCFLEDSHAEHGHILLSASKGNLHDEETHAFVIFPQFFCSLILVVYQYFLETSSFEQ
jgi:hypothetical protein